jgi:hypothetical protein
MFQYLTEENVFRRFELSKQYTDSLTIPFSEYQRLANNKPKPGLDKHYPRNTDGTTASIIHKTPRRVVQVLPTGRILYPDNDWVAIVANFILTHVIYKNANHQYMLIEKCWQAIEGSLTRGFSPIYRPYLHHGDYVGPDWVNPWWGDIFVQPGKISDEDSNYLFLRTWWREEDIEALIDRVGKMDKDDATDSGWNVTNLQEVKDKEQTKDEKAMTPTDRASAVNQRGGIELIIGLQRGIGSQFLMFHRESNLIVRATKNKDPRGEIPLIFNYCETNGYNPFGRGFVELVAPLQNLMDTEDQMYQFNRALMLAPPVKKHGTYNKSQLQLQPNAIWDLGVDPKNDAEPVTIDSTALANYSTLYSLNQSRLYQLLSAPTASVSQTAGNSQFSKTTQGVQQVQQNLSIDDNFIRKKFEYAFERWSEGAINDWFACHSGKEQLQLDSETASKLRDLAADKFDQSLLDENDVLTIDYDQVTEVIRFKVDPSSSQELEDQQQMQLMGQLQPLMTPQMRWFLGQNGWKLDLGQWYYELFNKSNVDNIDKIIYKMNDQEAQAALQEPYPIIDPPDIRLIGSVPPDAMSAALAMGGVNLPPGTNVADTPIKLEDIYKDPGTSPMIKAQIVQKAGLQPDINDTANQMDTNDLQHGAKQAEALNTGSQHLQQAANPAPPADQSGPQQQPPQTDPNLAETDNVAPAPMNSVKFSPNDMAAIGEMRRQNVHPQVIGEAMAMLHSGHPAATVMAHVTKRMSGKVL